MSRNPTLSYVLCSVPPLLNCNTKESMWDLLMKYLCPRDFRRGEMEEYMNQNSKKEFHHSKKYKILAVLCQIGILLTFSYCIVYEYLFLSLWSSIPLYLKLILIPLLIISYYFYVEGTICFILNKKSKFHIWIRQGITRFFHLSDSNS